MSWTPCSEITWGQRNPFTDQYVREEVEFYGKENVELDGVTISMDKPIGRLDDYLNKNFRTGALEIPIFRIDGSIWMSLTPMEVQSQHLAIQFAFDKCATLGLGMGHFALRVMADENVESLDVYEKDERVINLFKTRFFNRDGFDKLSFIEGDARETFKGKEYDYVYADIYPTLLGDEVVEDLDMFLSENDIVQLHWWGRERVLLAAIEEGLDIHIDSPTIEYFRRWAKTPLSGSEDNPAIRGTLLSELPTINPEADYINAINDVFERHEVEI